MNNTYKQNNREITTYYKSIDWKNKSGILESGTVQIKYGDRTRANQK